MSYFLAVDSGGTKADYVLADETTILARVRSGTIKRMRTDAQSAALHLDQALSQLADLSGVGMQNVTRTCIGTAGEAVPFVADWLREAFARRVGGSLLVVGDVEIALEAAFPHAGGVVVIAGTGSNVAGRVPGGPVTTAGGYGPVLADQGSGHRIGFEAARAAFLARDEGRPTLLMDAIQIAWSLCSVDEVIAYANSTPPPDLSKLTDVVVKSAALGDEVAQDVLRTQGEELGYLVCLLMRRLKASCPAPHWTPPLAFAGSILHKIPAVREALVRHVRKEFPQVAALPGVVDPIEGALLRARS